MSIPLLFSFKSYKNHIFLNGITLSENPISND
jgi:hypothetical protein